MGFTVDRSGHETLMAELKGNRMSQYGNVAEAQLVYAVNLVTSLTSQTKRGVNKGDGPRKMHPGNWADVTSNLVRAISHEVVHKHGRTEMTWGVIKREGLSGVTITDVIEYAEKLDSMNGINVLAGIEDVIFKNIVNALHRESKRDING